MVLIDSTVHDIEELGFDVFLLSVLDRLKKQIPESCSFEQLAKDVVDAATQSFACCFQLLKQTGIDLALAGVSCDEIPKVADLRLADPVNSTEALFNLVRVLRQIVVDHKVSALKVDTFACGVVGN